MDAKDRLLYEHNLLRHALASMLDCWDMRKSNDVAVVKRRSTQVRAARAALDVTNHPKYGATADRHDPQAHAEGALYHAGGTDSLGRFRYERAWSDGCKLVTIDGKRVESKSTGPEIIW